jgi:CubicO group peptidase (beta-lactamase class C family)
MKRRKLKLKQSSYFNQLTISIAVIVMLLFTGCSKSPTSSKFEEFVWKVSTPAEQGLQADLLDSALTIAGNHGFIDAFLVIRHGHIVAECYFNGYDINTAHNLRSDAKSFLSTLTGIALQKGYLDSLGEKVLDYFPEYIYEGMDPRKFDITIRHLLTMRMGIDDEDLLSFMSVVNSTNWIQTILEFPLLFDPGERMRYNTAQTHLLSAILQKACGEDLLEFARENLFKPMGITIEHWSQDPQGYYFGGSEMFFTPREMATLGHLYLNQGRRNQRQIVPADWVTCSLAPSTDFPPNAWGAWKNYEYAYLWWLGEFNGFGAFLAYGWGGQFIINFPALDLIVATTAFDNVDSDTSTLQEWAIFDIVADYVVKAVDN